MVQASTVLSAALGPPELSPYGLLSLAGAIQTLSMHSILQPNPAVDPFRRRRPKIGAWLSPGNTSLAFIAAVVIIHVLLGTYIPSPSSGSSQVELEDPPDVAPQRSAFARAFPGCLERPTVGVVKAAGSQPDCHGNADLKVETLNRIPKIIHQTDKSLDLSPTLQRLSATWVAMNPGWEVRHYDDDDCLAIVASEFPEYLDAYRALPKPVERADFFRYLVVLRYGGVYADMDTECRVPLDDYISEGDTLVAGWENEFPSVAWRVKRGYSRQRQLLQWALAGAPGHPALRAVCDHIQRSATALFSTDANTDTLDRTGPGAWTDAVLGYAMSPAGREAGSPWRVRLLPQVAFGAFGLDGLPGDAPGILIRHHFQGSWKENVHCNRWSKSFLLPRMALRWLRGEAWAKPPVFAPEYLLRPGSAGAQPEVPAYIPHVSGFSWSPDALSWSSRAQHDACLIKLTQQSLLEWDDFGPPVPHPVSVAWSPPFTMLVHSAGAEAAARRDGHDVSAHITAWGSWQAGWVPPLRSGPTAAEALLGVLGGGAGAGDGRPALLVDVGAGVGLFSLSAAARGCAVLAVEPEAAHRALLEASAAANGWAGLVTVVGEVPGGAEDAGAGLGGGVPLARARPGPGGCRAGEEAEGAAEPLDGLLEGALRDGLLGGAPGAAASLLRLGGPGGPGPGGPRSALEGAGRLLGGELLPHVPHPAAVLLEAGPGEGAAATAAALRRLEERHGYTGGLFHAGQWCAPALQGGHTWCRCTPGELSRRLSAGEVPEPWQHVNSSSILLLHSSAAEGEAGARWLAMMQKAAGPRRGCLPDCRFEKKPADSAIPSRVPRQG
eukprot:jgi/Tetstr1/446700/TSEL_003638.t1